MVECGCVTWMVTNFGSVELLAAAAALVTDAPADSFDHCSPAVHVFINQIKDAKKPSPFLDGVIITSSVRPVASQEEGVSMRVPAGGGSTEAPAKKVQQVVLADVFEIGRVEVTVNPKFKKNPTDPDRVQKDKVRVVLQLKEVDAEGKRKVVRGDYTFSTHAKADFMKLMKNWIPGFKAESLATVDELVGKLNGFLTIRWSGESEDFPNIGSISQIPDEVPAIALDGSYSRGAVYLAPWETLVKAADGVDVREGQKKDREPGDEDEGDIYNTGKAA